MGIVVLDEWGDEIPEPTPAQSYADLLALEIPPANPVIEGLIDEGAGVILAGPPGVGKTWVELSMASAIATGASWLCHFPTRQGPVLIIDEESHIRGLQSRLVMMENAHPIGLDAPIFFAVGQGVRMDTPEGLAGINSLIEFYQPVAIFLDSFTRLHGANENSAQEMAAVFRNAKALMRAHNVCLIFLDHVRKKSLLNDPEEMLRGSTEKRAWPDSIIYLSPVGKNELQVSHIKSRFSERTSDFRLKIEADSDRQLAEVKYDGSAPTQDVSKANDIIAAIHALNEQIGLDRADATAIAAWLDCSHDTVTRHAKKLVTAGILSIKTLSVGSVGGKGKIVYVVQGSRD